MQAGVVAEVEALVERTDRGQDGGIIGGGREGLAVAAGFGEHGRRAQNRLGGVEALQQSIAALQ